MKEKIHTIEIPEVYLLQIACAGEMGDGKLLDMMRNWAQAQADDLGLSGKVKEMQIERLREMRSRLRNTIGDELMDKLDSSIEKTISKLG